MSPTRGRVFPAVPLPLAGGVILPSPAQFYLTGEDRLRIVSANSLTGVRLKVHARLATADGDSVAQAWDHIPNTDRSVASSDYELGAGSLLNVTIFAATGTPMIGQTFVVVQLVRGFGAAAIVLGTLLAGYVTATQALGFPGSPIESSIASGGYPRTLIGTLPAPGSEFSESAPTGARWLLRSVSALLTTSAALGNRQAALRLSQVSDTYCLAPNGATIAASTNGTWGWTVGLPYAGTPTPGFYTAGLGDGVTMLAGHQFQSASLGLQAGDQWAAPVVNVDEWLEVF